MAIKKYVVREGFVFRVQNDNGSYKTYEAGDTVDLDEAEGDAQHQLERAGKAPAGNAGSGN